MPDDIIQILIATYTSAQAAEDGLKKLQTAKRDQGIDIIDAVVIKKNEHSHLHLHETEDVTGGRGATVGGILGGILGIMAGPGGIVAGAAVGALVGGAAAAALDTGIPHKRLTEIGQTLRSGSAALVVLAAQGYASFVESLLGGDGVEIHSEAMDADAARRLGHEHDVALKALGMGEALADGGLASPTGEEPKSE